jgi:3-keto-5-aminohexanoate cleavage enzyme
MDVNMKKLIINFTPTGMIPTKEMTAHVPVSASEIIADVHSAWEAGITMLHLHARDPITGRPSHEMKLYAELIAGIRAYAPELIICVSLSGRATPEFEVRAQALELEGPVKPDMGTLTLSSLNFNKRSSINEPEIIQKLARKMLEKGIRPELEAFDAGMINYAKYLYKKGLITPPFYFNLILGNIACAQPDLLHLGVMINDLPADSVWSVGAIGDFQLGMNSVAIAIGGGVRVGLEDNIWFDHERTKLARNIDLIKRIHILREANGRALMSSSELREILHLESGNNGRYGVKP